MTSTVDPTDCAQILAEFIERELLFGEGPALDCNTPLLGEGIMDSVSVVALVAFVEERFGVSVPDGEVAVEHLADLDALGLWVASLAGGGA